MSRETPYNMTAAAIVTLIALVLRLHQLDFESLFMDELRQVSIYSYSLQEIVLKAALQSQPPLDFWIGSIVNHFNSSDFALRLPAVIFGSMTVYLISYYCMKWFSLQAGLIVGSYLAINHFHIYFSQEARPYAISIFLFVALLVLIVELFRKHEAGLNYYIGLTAVAFLYMLTRTFVPMLSITVMIFMTLTLLAVYWSDRNLRQKSAAVSVSLLIALLCYLPLFMLIYAKNQRYASDTPFSLSTLLSRLENIDINTIQAIFYVPFETLAPLFVVLILVSAAIAVTAKPSNKIVSGVSAFLVMMLLAHLVIHYSKSGLPLRPPYAYYVLPLTLVVSAYAMQAMAGLISRRSGKAVFYIASCLTLLLPQSVLTHDFKNNRIKSDWRAAAEYSASNYDQNYMLLFETYSTQDKWSPTFYGFKRYDPGRITGVALEDLIDDIRDVRASPMRPALVLFHYRNYFLTSFSAHGVMPQNRPDPERLQIIRNQDELVIKYFTGLTIIELKHYSDNLYDDTYRLLSLTLDEVPGNSAAVKMAIIAAMFQNSSHQSKLDKLQQARGWSRDSQSNLFTKAYKVLSDLEHESNKDQ